MWSKFRLGILGVCFWLFCMLTIVFIRYAQYPPMLIPWEDILVWQFYITLANMVTLIGIFMLLVLVLGTLWQPKMQRSSRVQEELDRKAQVALKKSAKRTQREPRAQRKKQRKTPKPPPSETPKAPKEWVDEDEQEKWE